MVAARDGSEVAVIGVAVAFPATERQNQIIAIDACEAAFGRPLFAKTSTIEWHMAF